MRAKKRIMFICRSKNKHTEKKMNTKRKVLKTAISIEEI